MTDENAVCANGTERDNTTMNPYEEYEDVEIYIRRPSTNKTDDEQYVWTATYREMARLSTRMVIETVTDTELDEGQWEVGIREQGDEQYSQRFEITPLLSEEPDHEVQNRVASILNHWRQ